MSTETGPQAGSDGRRVVAAVLDRHGRTFASEAGIRLERNTPSPLFRLLCLSLLFSARIGAEVAMAAARALVDAGWTTPPAMADATWAQRTRVLNRAGYARYDESTSRYLGATAELVIERHGGDLRRLREHADGRRDVLGDGLTEFPGIGPTGAAIFLREVQVVWDEFTPFVDDRAGKVAAELGLPTDPGQLARLTAEVCGSDDARTFGRLVAGLVRVGLAGDHDAVR